MSFLEIQLDPDCSYGSKFGLYYNTLVQAVPSRAEQRIQLCSRAFRKATIDFDDKSRAQMETIRDFFIGVRGKRHSFRAKDWSDYKASAEPLTPFLLNGVWVAQLTKTYQTYGDPEIRPITKPQESRVAVTLLRDGNPYAPESHWTLDTTRGRITFSSNPTGHTFLWGGEFDVPVRFDFDEMLPSYTDFDIMDWSGVNLLEVAV